MTIEALRKVSDAHPFTPFVIHLADGRQFPVRHRDFIALGPAGRTILVYQMDESFDVLDVKLITGLQVSVGETKAGIGA
jgi:hypothetical protein